MTYIDWKRAIDQTMAVLVIILVAPLLIVMSLMTFILYGKPIIFKQTRLGLHERPFVIYKFRTLPENYDRLGVNDKSLPVITRFIRQFGLDELPQLFNILKGDMSFVGPRPLPTEYKEKISYSNIRSLVKPGLTGLAQINGRKSLKWNRKFELDRSYVQSICLLIDIKILLKTPAILFRESKIDIALK